MTARSTSLKEQTLAEFLDDMLEESGGPMTRAERREADRQLGLSTTDVERRRPDSHAPAVTAYTKIAISLPSRAAEHVRRAVRTGQAKSASAYIADAIEEKAKKETWQEFIEDMYAETGGPPTAAELRDARRRMGLPSRKHSKKR